MPVELKARRFVADQPNSCGQVLELSDVWFVAWVGFLDPAVLGERGDRVAWLRGGRVESVVVVG
ncbi:hypothetical protein [Amycolatopsis sp. NPDC051903]|uniref:hypothetical protein n=1 Tax=Amycolatopsis sp. NPDC051903 TaxID=3363936 RepID=UPI00379E1048